MIVVLDSNVWLKELALNSGSGSALRFFLKQRPARLAIPEVVRLEVQHHLRVQIEKSIEKVEKEYRELLALFGSMKEIVLPARAEVDALVSGVFTNLGIDTLDAPFTFESAKSSFMKTILKLPPSDKSQEFKDGVLWADCLDLLEKDDVLLATSDKAFFENRAYGSGLAQNLLDESKTKPYTLRLVDSIVGVLEYVRTDVPIDKVWFVSAVRARAHPSAEELLSREGIGISAEPIVKWDLFATENPEQLYFTYSIEYPCVDLSSGGRTEVRLLLGGDGVLRPRPPRNLDVRAGEEALEFTSPDGVESRRANVYGRADAVIGHRTVAHSVRHRLE
jgi:hypothetical protein